MKRFGGKGVLKAVGAVNGTIRDSVLGANASDQEALDATMIKLDGTDSKARLGANAILAVSLAAAKAAAADQGLPLYRHLARTGDLTLPVPMMNIINGGAHAGNHVHIPNLLHLPIPPPSFSEPLPTYPR